MGRYLAARHGELLHLVVAIAQHTNLDLRVLRAFQTVHRFLIGHLLAHEGLVVHHHNLVACQDASPLGGAVLDDTLHMDGIFADDELNPHARERTFQVVGGRLDILCADIDGMGVEVGQNLRDGPLHERVHVDRIHVLVAHDVEQVVQPRATAVDDVQAVGGEMVGEERAEEDADDHTGGHQQRHVAGVFFLFFHIFLGRCGGVAPHRFF